LSELVVGRARQRAVVVDLQLVMWKTGVWGGRSDHGGCWLRG